MVFGKRIMHLRGMVSIIFPGRINARENTESFQRSAQFSFFNGKREEIAF
jgi:hypothetical protein